LLSPFLFLQMTETFAEESRVVSATLTRRTENYTNSSLDSRTVLERMWAAIKSASPQITLPNLQSATYYFLWTIRSCVNVDHPLIKYLLGPWTLANLRLRPKGTPHESARLDICISFALPVRTDRAALLNQHLNALKRLPKIILRVVAVVKDFLSYSPISHILH
jgi:hypothetical protein